MAIDIIIGTNSYISVADADIYFNERLFSEEWTNSVTDNKAKALIMATKKIDNLRLRGMKANQEQTLQFPRAIYSNIVVKVVKTFFYPCIRWISTPPILVNKCTKSHICN